VWSHTTLPHHFQFSVASAIKSGMVYFSKLCKFSKCILCYFAHFTGLVIKLLQIQIYCCNANSTALHRLKNFFPSLNIHHIKKSYLKVLDLSEMYEGVSKRFQTGCLEQELQRVQLCATLCSYITILLVSLVSFSTITLCVASQQVLIVVVYFIINSVWKLLDIPLYFISCINSLYDENTLSFPSVYIYLLLLI
jgi:hypothetical protein